MDVPIPKDLLHLFSKTLLGPFDLTINHWDPGHLFITREARKMTRVAVAWCVDEATEILTSHGWLKWDEVREGDRALGINPETGLSEWQEIEHIYRSGRAVHDMVRLKTVAHESVSTPNHRWLVRRQAGGFKWKQSDALRAGDLIPCAVPCADLPAEPKYSDAFVELVAWTYTEGWLERGRSVRIGQNERVNPGKTQRIRAALRASLGEPRDWGEMLCLCCGRGEPAGWHKEDHNGHGWIRARGLCHSCYMRKSSSGVLSQWRGYETWTESPRKPDGMVIFNLSRHASQEILEACPGKVPSMPFLLSLTRAQLELFLEVSLEADGHARTFAQTRGPRLDAFVFASILAGKRPSHAYRTGWDHLATVALLSSTDAKMRKRGEHVRYEGAVWCPSVRHGNWMARRGGRVFYTGNTMWEFQGGPGPRPDSKAQAIRKEHPDWTDEQVTTAGGKLIPGPVSGLYPHCEAIEDEGPEEANEPAGSKVLGLRSRLQWFDLVLGYDQVTLDAIAPFVPGKVHSSILQGGYDSRFWKHMDRDWFGDRFQFLMHGALNARKMPWTTIEAFQKLKFEKGKEFAGARLALHTSAPGTIFSELNVPFEKTGIKVFVEVLDKQGLDALYQSSHCLLAPSRGEGKNLPALEFMTTGGVVAATNFGGHLGWMNADYAYPLDYELGPTFGDCPWGARDAKVSVGHLADVIWHIWSNRGEAREKARKAEEIIPKMCDWQVVLERLFRRIGDNVGGPGPAIYEHAMACRKPPPEDGPGPVLVR